jgi:SAM-dependent methyltransferase
MRRFRRPGAFDAAINLYTSYGYFEDPADDLAVARNVCRSLRPGGAALFEMVGKELLAAGWHERSWRELDGDVLVLEERHIGDDWEWLEWRWIIAAPSGRRRFRVRHRLYSGRELRSVLLSAGFESVTLYGTLDGTRYDGTARHLVAVARRAPDGAIG